MLTSESLEEVERAGDTAFDFEPLGTSQILGKASSILVSPPNNLRTPLKGVLTDEASTPTHTGDDEGVERGTSTIPPVARRNELTKRAHPRNPDPYKPVLEHISQLRKSSLSLLSATLEFVSTWIDDPDTTRNADVDDNIARRIAEIEVLIQATRNTMSRAYLKHGIKSWRFARTEPRRLTDDEIEALLFGSPRKDILVVVRDLEFRLMVWLRSRQLRAVALAAAFQSGKYTAIAWLTTTVLLFLVCTIVKWRRVPLQESVEAEYPFLEYLKSSL